MYHTSYFKEKDLETILNFIETHPFAFLTGSFVNGTQVATQAPVLLEKRNGDFLLQTHLKRNTDHHRAFKENPQALVVFTGPHAYVSATWYSDSRMGSTWNYMSVHASGKIREMDTDEMNLFMEKFTSIFEGGDHQSPTVFNNLSHEYRLKKVPAIVGLEIKIDTLNNVFKLSQNKDKASYLNIINELEKRDTNSKKIALEMKKRFNDVFK